MTKAPSNIRPLKSSELARQIGLAVCQTAVCAGHTERTNREWTRELGDLLIVASAMANNDAPW